MAISSKVLISVKHLVKEYNHGTVHALDGCDLDIHKGEVVAIIGPSGSGKSTFLRCLNLLEQPTAGTITFAGTEITDPKVNIDAMRRQMGMVFQHFNLFPNMTVRKNMSFALETKKAPKEEIEKRVNSMSAMLGLDELLDRKPAQLSGGQKQRICIARAILKKPKVLILDDSTSAVDTATEAKIREGLAKKLPDMTKIVIAQRISSVRHADQIIILDKGRINGIGTHESLLADNRIYQEIYESQKEGAEL